MFRLGLHNMSKGEIGPQLYGRIDTAAYSAAVRRARNVVVLKYGGLQRRMGTRVVYEIREPALGWDDPDSEGRLFPFEFSLEQTYALLFTQAAMRPLALGGAVLEDELAITDISNEVEALIEIPFHAYAEGDEWFATGIEGEIGALLNNRTWLVTEIVSADTFRINADTSALDAFTGADGGEVRVGAPPPPPAPPAVPPPADPPPPPDTTLPDGNPGFPGAEIP